MQPAAPQPYPRCAAAGSAPVGWTWRGVRAASLLLAAAPASTASANAGLRARRRNGCIRGKVGVCVACGVPRHSRGTRRGRQAPLTRFCPRVLVSFPGRPRSMAAADGAPSSAATASALELDAAYAADRAAAADERPLSVWDDLPAGVPPAGAEMHAGAVSSAAWRGWAPQRSPACAAAAIAGAWNTAAGLGARVGSTGSAQALTQVRSARDAWPCLALPPREVDNTLDFETQTLILI